MGSAAPTPQKSSIGLLAAVCIGIGGMVGAGIFSILGVVAEAAGNALWLSFLIGGVVALLSTYSYSKLGARYPSAGGAVEFLVQGYGDGILSGAVNIFLWLGYVIALALYANAFAGYAMTFFGADMPVWLPKALAIGIVLLFTAINARGAKSMGSSETVIVVIKVGILVLFAAAGAFFIHPDLLSPSKWPASQEMFFGAGVLFIGYEGFGLVANTAGDMANPQKLLPRALYISVLSVIAIYLSVSVVVIGNLAIPEIVRTKDYALAAAAQPFLGSIGFKLIAIAALFSTSSAINATLFGGANVSYMVAKDGQLPKAFGQMVRGKFPEGLILTAALVILFVLLFDLSKIAMMGSAAFLLVYAAVNGAHLKLIKETKAKAWIVWLSIATCLGMFGVLSVYISRTAPDALYAMFVVLAASFGIEIIYRRVSKRTLKAANP